MIDSTKMENKVWRRFEAGLIFIFLFSTIATFFFNYLKYAWQTNLKWLISFVYSNLGLTVWGIKLWSALLVFSLGMSSIVSLGLLISRILKPVWFNRTFRLRYWYGIFTFQIVTWILIFSL
jgi:hypothetical protein